MIRYNWHKKGDDYICTVAGALIGVVSPIVYKQYTHEIHTFNYTYAPCKSLEEAKRLVEQEFEEWLKHIHVTKREGDGDH